MYNSVVNTYAYNNSLSLCFSGDKLIRFAINGATVVSVCVYI